MKSIILALALLCSVGTLRAQENPDHAAKAKWIICIQGTFPSRSGGNSGEAMLGEIKRFAGNFAPAGWAYCDGQPLLIAEYTALFSILGTQYGGDGRTSFHLPELNSRD